MARNISIQGQLASFHHLAALKFFKNDIEILSCDNFKETCQKVLDESADFAVCAIENSLYGSTNEVYDLLVSHKLWIVGEIYLRINQNQGWLERQLMA